MSKAKQEKSVGNDRRQSALDNVAIWASYYRANPHRYASERLNITLKLFQKILLYMMNICHFFCYIAARGQGKSFLVAVFCCIRCVLYPGTKICIASGTRLQSMNILEKIKNEIIPNSPELAHEISNMYTSNAAIEFKNGSVIKVVTASDTARFNRANILIVDEFRLVNEDTTKTVLRRFLTNPRMPKYLHDPKYQHLAERNKEIYLSSAFFKNHWSFGKVKDFCLKMTDDTKRYFVCGLPYQLSIHERLLDKDAVADEMAEADFSETKWSMEMECLWFGDTDGSFFDFDSISKNRKMLYPMLPAEVAMKLPGSKRLQIQPKQAGEKRILSADIALMSSKRRKNDATSIFVNQLTSASSGRCLSNIIYAENAEGLHTEDQALRIRKLYEEFQCDYIVLDVKGVGLGVYDALAREIVDPITGDIYEALSCCNNPDLAERCDSPLAAKVIWAINASAKFNSDCAVALRDGFRTGKIKLLVSEYEAEELFSDIKGFNSLSPFEKLQFTLPYINTTLLINELINLRHEEYGGLIKISEKSGMRKDRYSSLSYNYWVALQLEAAVRRETFKTVDIGSDFVFRAPKIRS